MIENVNKLDFIKIKIFCSVKDSIKRIRDSLSPDDKESAHTAGDPGSIPVSGRSPGGSPGSSLHYSKRIPQIEKFLENSMDRRAWWAIVHGVAKSRT